MQRWTVSRNPAREGTVECFIEGRSGQRPSHRDIADAAFDRWTRSGGEADSNWLISELALLDNYRALVRGTA